VAPGDPGHSDSTEPTATAAATTTAAAPDSERGRRLPVVLVVDDEADILRSVHMLLRRDYRVITRDNGADALAFLRDAPTVAAVLADQRMPGMTGVELLHQAAAVRPQTTRVLFTAYTDLGVVIDAINQGDVFRYIAKPWEPGELEAAVRQAVERHDLLAEKDRLMTELQAANARLTEANRLQTAFLEVASHELNTPVTVILGLAELWRLSRGPDASADERDWIDRIHAAAGRLARTVDRMFTLVENEEFAHVLNVETVAVETLIADALESLRPHLEARRQTVSATIQPGLAPIQCDPSKIHDVLLNLLANAIKFSPDRATIAIEAGDAPANPGWVRVAIRDQGRGVTPAEQRHLFDPFFTGFDTLRHSSGEYQFDKRGIGLGLCLVKAFVDLHGGRIEVSSAPGQGSTFAVLLPRSRPSA